MLKCKVASEASCGHIHCCHECEDVKTCAYTCDIYEALGERVLTKCNNIEQSDELVSLDQQVPEVIKAITDITVQKKKLEEQEALMRTKLLEAMEQYGVKAFENDVVKFTYVAPTEKKSIDSAKLKKEHPEIASAYQKVTPVKAYVKIEVK